MRHFFPTTSLGAALLILPLSGALAQTSRPLPPITDFTAGADGCRATHIRTAQAATAQRVRVADPNHERLMNRYDVRWAQINIALERTTNEIGAGTSVLTRARNLSAAAPLDTIGFELNPGLTLDSLTVNGQRVPTARIERRASGDVRVRPLTPVPAGAMFDYVTWYHGVPAATGGSFFGQGITSDSDSRYGNPTTWTLSSPFATSDWCPSKQVLADKLDSVAVNVTTDATNKAGSNGLLRRTVPLAGGKMRYEWASRYPIDYYLPSVTVSDFQEHVQYAHPVNLPSAADSIPIISYLYANPQALTDAQPWLDLTAPLIENYSVKYGLYPFWEEKYGHCMAPIGGGMEHQTMSTMGGFGFTLVAHELMHQWFGDHVTCRSYRDMWLNEGFATYGEYVSIQALAPAGIDRQWLAGYRQQGLAFRGSVVLPATADTLSVPRIFSGQTTYAKGGLVLHALRHLINNDSVYFAGIRAYQRDFSHSTATTADLRASLEAAWNRPLGWFFDQWLYGEGFARANVRWNQVGQTLFVEVEQTATAPASVPFFRMPLEIDYVPGAGQPAVTVRLEQTQPTQLFTIPLPSGTTVSSISVDPRLWNLLQILRTRRDNLLLANPAELAVAPLTVYPNPCADVLTVPANIRPRTADVLDLAGRRVLRAALPAGADRLVTAVLAPGTYVLRLTEDGGTARQVRFSKQ
ncbi:MAG: T9SS type A sorting domain-containing protein [Hymenobacteraceae bacterium]|nr:T9SS type A sorting domain-containing protein [Hymenobacteraceae bacterium]